MTPTNQQGEQKIITPKGEIDGKNKVFEIPFDIGDLSWNQCMVKNSDGTWSPAEPLPYTPNLFERIKHAFGKHWSYGQPFCVICYKEI